MSKKLGMCIDPGMSSGIVIFTWDDDEPYERVGAAQVPGGAAGLLAEMAHPEVRNAPYDIIVMEKFTPREHGGFNLTEKAVEPLRCEGAILALLGPEKFARVAWQAPAMQYFMGGKDLRERKKNSREFLKKHGLHLTGKDVERPDADDAISATLHSIAYMRRISHEPTLDKMFPDMPWI